MTRRKHIVASIEARMTSTRLPGKILMPCVGKPMLELLVERVKQSKYIEDIMIATTTNNTDDMTVDCAKRLGIGYYRGSEEDVVGRVTEAMTEAKADIVVQLTGDCPLLDWNVIDQLIRLYMFNNFDYVSNTLIRSYPRGLDVQITSLKVLQESLHIARDLPQHEHVYLSVYENPDKFKLFNLIASSELCRPDLRWTLDTQDDFNFIDAIYNHFYKKNPAFTSREIISYLEKYPEIVELNRDVQQKKVR